MVKNYAVEKVRCKIWQEHQKICLFLFSSLIMQDEQKGCILWGSKCCSCWVLNLYLIIINVFREEGCDFWLISGWFVQYLPSLLAVWLVCQWFVGDLTGLWVVLNFTANNYWRKRQFWSKMHLLISSYHIYSTEILATNKT